MNDLAHLDACPLVVILRGLAPEEAAPIGRALVDAGVRAMEVPLSSPRSIDALRLLADAVGHGVLVGAGTVMSIEQVHAAGAVGARLFVSPNVDEAVVKAVHVRGLVSMPGVATPTEAWRALNAGANLLKLFPGELLTPPVVRAWRSVMPPTIRLYPVGGVTLHNLDAYRAAGASGVGVGGAIFKHGAPAAEVGAAAAAFVRALGG